MLFNSIYLYKNRHEINWKFVIQLFVAVMVVMFYTLLICQHIFICEDIDTSITNKSRKSLKFNDIPAFHLTERMYLDINKTHPATVTNYYLYKELLTIMNNGVIFYLYRIDYDIDYFFLNEEYNIIVNKILTNSYIQDRITRIIEETSSINFPLVNSILNLDELVLDLSMATLYWSSEPTFKYYIPYPFVASGNFQYHDYWWLHISVYYYWLWFFFIFLIIFFLISVMWEINYNIIKNNPQRETRGVSRSKCGDLITAIVPISWASAIIIHESTDAIDHFDGFGTLDFVVGIRAFQWGWEYYYPNNLKINYTNSDEKTFILGNSSLTLSHSDNYSTAQNLKHLTINKSKNLNILPLYLICNPDLNKTFFNINKMGNFGYSKLCIYTAYKYTLNNKAINYHNILNSTVNLTNFNVKKLFNNYSVDVNSNNNNFKQFKLPNAKSIKLFKKYYNKHDVNFFSSDITNKSIRPLSINSFNFFYYNTFLTLPSYNIINNTVNCLLNNKKLNPDLTNYLNISPINYIILNNIPMNYFNKTSNFDSIHNIEISQYNTLNSTTDLEIINKLNNEKFYYLDKLYNLVDLFIFKKLVNTNLNFFPNFLNNYYADLDFKRIQQNELLEDLYWDFYFNDNNLDETNTQLFKDLEFNYKIFKPYSIDTTLDLKTLYTTLNWFNHYKNTLYYINNILYKNNWFFNTPTLFNKINFVMDFSFNNYKNVSLIIGTTNLNLFSKYDNTRGILNFSNLLNNFNKLNSFIINGTNMNNLNFINYKGLLTGNLGDNIKNYQILINSFWKIFKYSYYDERFFYPLVNFSFSNQQLPIQDLNNLNLYSIINKNIQFFVKTVNYNKLFFKYNNILINKYYNLHSLISFELPFDVSSECDLFKYSWIDWYNFYSKRETKFQDLKEYNLNGSKLFYNKYDYFFSDNNELMIIENYFNKLLNNRKNYTNLYNFVPYLLMKNNFMFNNHQLKSIFSTTIEECDDLMDILFLNYCQTFDKTIIFFNKNTFFLNNNNSFFSYNKNFLNTLNTYNTYNNYILMLNNILVKRAFFIKQLFYNNFNYNVLNNFNTTLNNSIISDWKTILFNEHILDNSTNNNKNLLALQILKTYNFNFNIPDIDFSQKTQYNHMRKSINNMLRLQNDKAVCMPTDTRIQILTWSKDIIHSWAIPAAGIKIDCIPGYSSHKVFNMLLTGIYYGQCMEICGRFHHWMPIVVYFVRRDLFLFWCTNFLNSKKNESIGINKNIKNTTNNGNL